MYCKKFHPAPISNRKKVILNKNKEGKSSIYMRWGKSFCAVIILSLDFAILFYRVVKQYTQKVNAIESIDGRANGGRKLSMTPFSVMQRDEAGDGRAGARKLTHLSIMEVSYILDLLIDLLLIYLTSSP
jgi:hypothetical protein